MVPHKLTQYIRKRRATILGVGPMSKNCVDATIEAANTFGVPILSIASRRQIDAEDFGGGYVNHWSTERFAQYVTDHDKSGNVILARDHGGPWQNSGEAEARLSFRHAMNAAKKSFEVDIASGFDIVHIDPSVDIFTTPSIDDILERLFELYEFCYRTARRLNREVSFEIGTEEQHAGVQDLDQMEYVLEQVTAFCRANGFPNPLFVVAQTGTKVMEMRNLGTLDSPFRVDDELPAEIQIPRTIALCDRYNIFLKEHNADYMSDEVLRWHPKLGVHAVNIAPEFGVTESRTLVAILNERGLGALADDFLRIAFESQKWRKWVLPDTRTTDEEKGLIAGHYLFGDQRVEEILQRAQVQLRKRGEDIHTMLKEAVKAAIVRYLRNFNMLGRG